LVNYHASPGDGGLRHDPIEDDPAIRPLIQAATAEAEKQLEHSPEKGHKGFVHLLWHTEKDILKKKYGVDWKTPAEMNPRAIID
jgi:hypothetical protein